MGHNSPYTEIRAKHAKANPASQDIFKAGYRLARVVMVEEAWL